MILKKADDLSVCVFCDDPGGIPTWAGILHMCAYMLYPLPSTLFRNWNCLA